MKNYLLILVITTFSLQAIHAQNVGVGTTDPKAKLDVAGDLILRSADLTLLDGNTHDLDVNTIKLNHYKLIGPTSNFQIGGILAAEHDRIVTLYNRAGVSLEVYNEDIFSVDSNRILTGTSGTFAIYPGGNVSLKYDNTINRWEIISSHYNSLDNFGSGNWALSGDDIYNGNVGKVGIGTSTPSAKLTLNGNIALLSDTILSLCSTIIPPSINDKIIINNLAKQRSIFHIMKDTSCDMTMSPQILGINGGTDGQIVNIFFHMDNCFVRHLVGITGSPTSMDSLNMIELFEPNGNGNINQPQQISFNAGAAITLIYDGIRNRWKPINYYGEVKNDVVGWYKGPNPNDIYNPNSGNVGIGTGLPSEKLEVSGSIEISGEIKPNGNSGTNGQVLTSLGNGIMNWLPNVGWPTSGNDIKNPNSGNVGIGSFPSLGFKFDVSGNGRFSGSNISGIQENGCLSTNTLTGIVLRTMVLDGQRIQSSGGLGNVFPYNPTPKDIYLNPLGGSVSIGIEDVQSKLSIYQPTIESNGNSHLLHLRGQNPVQFFSDQFNTTRGYIKGVTNLGNSNVFGNFGIEVGAAGGDIYFTSAGYQCAMMINGTTNNIGIGTIYPSHKLSVNGTIRTKEVIVEAANWPDYVFEKEYALPSLHSIEKFINEHGHLPSIPSAKHIEENGQPLGDTQKKMMEKIEELTLYIIQLNKEVELLKNKQNK